MGILSDFYQKVAKFFKTQEEMEEQEASKSVATNRLKLVLMQDRTNLTPKILEQMRGELIELLSKYVELDKDLLDLNFEHEGDQVALMLSIPVIRAKDEAEIEKALEEAKHKNIEQTEEKVTDETSEEESDENSDSEDTSNVIETTETEAASDESTENITVPEDLSNKTEEVKEEQTEAVKEG